MTAVLKSKLHIPLLRHELVPRPRLVEQLGRSLDHKLTLISSSAGSGKTTLLSQWAAHCERPVAWLSLDPQDDSPVRFWIHLIAALQTISVDLGVDVSASLESALQPSVDEILASLINELVALPNPIAIQRWAEIAISILVPVLLLWGLVLLNRMLFP